MRKQFCSAVPHFNQFFMVQLKEMSEKSDKLDNRQKKLPQMLVTSSDLSMGIEDEEEQLERENAQLFVKALQDELKNLNSARGTVEIDQRLQEFASKFCHGNISSH